jgi:hypothetical protein
MPACLLLSSQKTHLGSPTSVRSSLPPRVLEYLLLLLLPRVGLHGALSPAFFAPLSCHLLGLLLCWAADGPVYLAEDVGFDRWKMSAIALGLQLSIAAPSLTIHTVRAQDMQPLDPPAARAPAQRCDVLQALARHEPLALLAV